MVVDEHRAHSTATERPLILSLALFVYGIGVTFLLLSFQREPGGIVVLLRGALFGAVLVHVVMPILAWTASPRERARQIGLWLVSATTAAIALYPRALLLPVLNSIETFTAVEGIISFVL